jgi:very-short-patch-repair endonuclease
MIFESSIELKLLFQIRAVGLPEPRREFRFHPIRKWHFDFAWPERMIAVEIDGGQWVQGRHTRGAGFQADCEKNNEAVILGWRVLHFVAIMVESGEALKIIEQVI